MIVEMPGLHTNSSDPKLDLQALYNYPVIYSLTKLFTYKAHSIPHHVSEFRARLPKALAQSEAISTYLSSISSYHYNTMVVVAVAGGNGDVGKAIVEELVSVGKHTIIVLTRAVS